MSGRSKSWLKWWALPTVGLWIGAVGATPVMGQEAPKPSSTPNVQRISHVPLAAGPAFSRSDVEIEQELSRPYVYVSRIMKPTFGFDIISVADPENAHVIYEWRIENAELHNGLGAMDPKYFKHEGRYYLVQSVQFAPGGRMSISAQSYSMSRGCRIPRR